MISELLNSPIYWAILTILVAFLIPYAYKHDESKMLILAFAIPALLADFGMLCYTLFK